MPILPLPSPISTAVFWDAEDILNFARILTNDVQGGLTGQELSDDKPYTWPLLNFCYANLAAWLEDSNVESATYEETVIGPLAAAPLASSDPTTQVRLGYDGYWYGDIEAVDVRYTLPYDCLMPLDVSYRQVGSSGRYYPVKQYLGGLPQRSGGWGPIYWEMRKNSLIMTGFIQSVFLKLRYIPALPLLVQPTAGQPSPLVPLARCGPALAYMVAAEFSEIRNAPNAPRLRAKANEQLDVISNRSAKRENQVDQRRRGYGFSRRRRSW